MRKYELSAGKRKALAKLMIRDDVPIRVRPLDDGIEVHASEAHQAIFKAFAEMIESDAEQSRTYKLPKGKLGALSELMIRSDVPVRVSPGDDGITVYGSPAVQAVFEAFIHTIHPQGAKKVRGRTDAAMHLLEAYGAFGEARLFGEKADALERDRDDHD